MLCYQDTIHIGMQNIRPLPPQEVPLAEAPGQVLVAPGNDDL